MTSMCAAESGPQMGRAVEKQVRFIWRFVMMPLMFGLVGASINFATIPTGTIAKACAIVVAGASRPVPCVLFVLLVLLSLLEVMFSAAELPGLTA